MLACSPITTMCSYGNFLNTKALANSSHSILPGELAEALQTTNSCRVNSGLCQDSTVNQTALMLLDCRSFLAYNFKHIAGALNVNCTGIGKKRLQQGKASLVDLISSDYGKEFVKNGKWVTAVVYDESTSELEKAPSSHPVKLVLSALLSQGKEAFLLKGGLKGFALCYQDLLSVRTSDHNDGVSSAVDRINCLAKYRQDECVNQSNPSCLNVRATEVLPHIFLGNAKDAHDTNFLEENNVRYILNLTTNCPNYYSHNTKYHYQQIKIEDSCGEDIKPILEEAIAFIDEGVAENAGVLIHCQGGVSRSPTITIAYLMHINKLSLTDAYEFVKRKRPCISPNFNFMGQLLDIEKKERCVNSETSRCELIKKMSLCKTIE